MDARKVTIRCQPTDEKRFSVVPYFVEQALAPRRLVLLDLSRLLCAASLNLRQRFFEAL